MGKFFKYLGILFLTLMISFVAFFAYTSFTGVDKEEIFIPFIKTNIPKLSTWEYEVYKELMVPPKEQTVEQLKLYLKWFHKLGKYKSMGSPILLGANTVYSQEKGTLEYASYNIPLVFSTGNASASLILVYNNNTVKIHKIQFNSDVLIKEDK